jgi:hypothetical protein
MCINLFDLIMHLTYLQKPQLTDIGWLKRAFSCHVHDLSAHRSTSFFRDVLDRIPQVSSPSPTLSLIRPVWRDCFTLVSSSSLDLPVLRSLALKQRAARLHLGYAARVHFKLNIIHWSRTAPAVLIPNLYQFGDCSQATFLNHGRILRFLGHRNFFVRGRALSISSFVSPISN